MSHPSCKCHEEISEKSSKTEEKDLKTSDAKEAKDYPIARLFTRIGIILILFVSTYATIRFCSSIYFDRYAVYNDSVRCTIDILNKNDAEFWLRNGTLLGATRLGKLILWDSDLSFGITKNAKNPVIFQDLHKKCFRRSFYTDGNVLSKWYMCSSNICAVFDEARVNDGMVETAAGMSPLDALFPLQECTLMDAKAHCPNNAPFYLQSAFGRNWLTTPFMQLFGANGTSH